jgi:hypothetical protein
MPLEVVDSNEATRAFLLEKLERQIPDAILVNSNGGFERLEQAFATGRPVIAYGPKPQSMGDSRYLAAFATQRRYAYVHIFETKDGGIEAFLSTYRHITRPPVVAEVVPPSIPKKKKTVAPRKKVSRVE